MWIFVLIVIILLAAIIAAILLLRRHKDESDVTLEFAPEEKDRQEIKRFGEMGEQVVASFLEKIVNAYDGYVLNGFAFKDDKRHSAEIDHILIATAGVFIIETKSNVGVLSGQKNDPVWHARKKQGQESKDLQNPLQQNQVHISRLISLFGKNAPSMASLVIFPFANIVLVSDLVYNLVTAKEYLEERFASPRYSLEKVEDIYQEFIYLKKRYGISKEEHVQKIEKSHP